MYNVFFAVKKADLKEEDFRIMSSEIKRCFKNRDHMEGYATGYGFGKISILDNQLIDIMHNNGELSKHYIFAVTVEED